MAVLTTEFQVAQTPLPAYPRPQMARTAWQNLNGTWRYAILDTAQGSPSADAWQGDIVVPFAPESALSGVQRAVLPEQTLWYSRTFTIENYDADKVTLLQFGAVDYACAVYVNGRPAGTHEGGYCPFTFDITELVTAGENTIIVSVTDATDKGDMPRGKQVLEPKGIWYTAVTGIWQTVWLEQVPRAYIAALRITPALDSVAITPVCTEDMEVSLALYDGEECVARAVGASGARVELHVEQPKQWTPETPFLYRLTLSAGQDTVESYCGLRTFGMGKTAQGAPCFLLNGKPYFQKGVLDQGYWPDGLYTAPGDDALCFDIAVARELGFNMLRKHIKVEPARWYYHCARLGMLVWQDMPCGGAYIGDFLAVSLPNLNIHVNDENYKRFKRENSAGREAFSAELHEMQDALYNTVSVCTWVPFNEGWGQFDADKVTQSMRAIDKTRLIDHASGWHDQHVGDYRSIHKYILKVRAPRGKDDRIFALTEYGGYSQVLPEHVWDEGKSFGYRMYKTKQALTDAFTRLHQEQIIPLIEKGLAATVYTQLTDVELEVNGVLSYDRRICKLDGAAVRAVNAALRFPEQA